MAVGRRERSVAAARPSATQRDRAVPAGAGPLAVPAGAGPVAVPADPGTTGHRPLWARPASGLRGWSS